jgi:hypothetical protein
MLIRSKDILALTILTFITILAWIGFEAYHTAATSTIPERLEILVQPLSPELPTDVVQILKSQQ